MLNHKEIEIKIKNWNELTGLFQDMNNDGAWIYRGQSNSKWGLTPTLERAILVFKEKELFEEFSRNAHMYYKDYSKIESKIEWLSLMQHHGAPTRLLDWTRSPYVGTFFALNNMNDKSGSSVLWSFNLSKINKKLVNGENRKDRRFQPLLTKSFLHNNFLFDNDFAKVFLSEWEEDNEYVFPSMVLPISPYFSHPRLTIQQGLFLSQTRIFNDSSNTISFEKALIDTVKLPPTKEWIRKYLIPYKLRKTILKELNYMNINDTTLFPGIDGFARYLSKKISWDI